MSRAMNSFQGSDFNSDPLSLAFEMRVRSDFWISNSEVSNFRISNAEVRIGLTGGVK